MSQTIYTEIQATMAPDELREVSGLSTELFDELMELGVLNGFDEGEIDITRCALVFSKANRLQKAFELDSNALALLIHYMLEAEELRKELHKTRLLSLNPYL